MLLLAMESTTLITPDFQFQSVTQAIRFDIQIVDHLQSEPEIGRHFEVLCKPQCSVRCNTALLKNDFIHSSRWYS